MDDDRKYFDVSKPRRSGPYPTSKPVIVGHQPAMPDPMIKEPAEASPNPPTVPRPDLSDLSAPHETSPAFRPAAQAEPEPVFTPTPNPSPDVTPPSHPTGYPSAGRVKEPESFGPQEPVRLPAGNGNYHHKPRIWAWLLVLLVILAGIYAAVDAATDVKLPFEIFKQTATTEPTQDDSANRKPTPQTSLPAGFARYQVNGTAITFAYPETWGTPTTTTDQGFSQRGPSKESDGAHAYLVSFANNKDIEVAITSSKYLPAGGARATAYYDFLQWCVGTNDSKFYKQSLRFSTQGGVDTPTTVVCDQGPLNATKISDAVLLEANAPGLGDVYTANLNDASTPVFRVKDAKMAHGEDVKKIFGTIAAAQQ